MTYLIINKEQINAININNVNTNRQIGYVETINGDFVINADLLGAKGWEFANAYLATCQEVELQTSDFPQSDFIIP